MSLVKCSRSEGHTLVRLAAGTPVAKRFTYEPVPISQMNLSPLPSSRRKLEATCCRLTSGVPEPMVVILQQSSSPQAQHLIGTVQSKAEVFERPPHLSVSAGTSSPSL